MTLVTLAASIAGTMGGLALVVGGIWCYATRDMEPKPAPSDSVLPYNQNGEEERAAPGEYT